MRRDVTMMVQLGRVDGLSFHPFSLPPKDLHRHDAFPVHFSGGGGGVVVTRGNDLSKRLHLIKRCQCEL